MSLVGTMFLSSGAFAGKITGSSPTDDVLPLTQFGFGGLNFDNVEVEMVTAVGNPTIVGTFNTADGTSIIIPISILVSNSFFTIIPK